MSSLGHQMDHGKRDKVREKRGWNSSMYPTIVNRESRLLCPCYSIHSPNFCTPTLVLHKQLKASVRWKMQNVKKSFLYASLFCGVLGQYKFQLHNCTEPLYQENLKVGQSDKRGGNESENKSAGQKSQFFKQANFQPPKTAILDPFS